MRPLKQAIYSSRTADKFVVRLPDGMRERINEVAKLHHRSMNSEIISRLERTLLEEVGAAPENTLASQAQDLVRALDIQPWNPRVGDLVKRRDTNRPLGTIVGFELSSLGVMAKVEQFEGEPVRQAVGLLEPMDISEILEGSGGPILRALEKVYQGKKDGVL